MISNFQPTSDEARLPQVLHQEMLAPEPHQEVVRITATGSPDAVKTVVHDLHSRRFAEANDWSPPVPTGRIGEVMRVLMKRIWLG